MTDAPDLIRGHKCERAGCKRPAKLKHECVICKKAIYTCNLHAETLYKRLQAHVYGEHPLDVAAAKMGVGKPGQVA